LGDDRKASDHLERALLPKKWSVALDAFQGITRSGLGWRYTGKHDVKALALMLASGEPVPTHVAKAIATHLSPPKGRWSGRLRHEPPPKRAITFFENLHHKRKAKADLDAMRFQGVPYKIATDRTAKKYRQSEGWVRGLGKFDFEKATAEAMRRLDGTTLQP
jgi:hypothetical protein